MDRMLGLRGWGLILYSTMPASLAFFSPLPGRVKDVNQVEPFLLIATIVPIIVVFLLIRMRYKMWYLTTELLFLRTVFMTSSILVLATIVCGVAGMLSGSYEVNILLKPDTEAIKKMAEHSFVLATVSLVISSTILMSSLTKDANLPGLPAPDFVAILKQIRQGLTTIQNSKIWIECIPSNQLTELIKVTADVKEKLKRSQSISRNLLGRMSLLQLSPALDVYAIEIHEIKIRMPLIGDNIPESAQSRWRILFGELKTLSGAEASYRHERKSDFEAIQRINRLRLGR